MGQHRSWATVLAAYKYRARVRGYKWLLTKEEFYAILKKPCHYCGDLPREAKGNHITRDNICHWYSGIDRSDNKPIYSKKTVVACCAVCNRMKSDFKRRDFLEQVRKVAKTHPNRKTSIKRSISKRVR